MSEAELSRRGECQVQEWQEPGFTAGQEGASGSEKMD